MTTPTAPAPPALAATRMAHRLTTPFERGADTLELPLLPFDSSQVTVADYDFSDHLARFDAAPEPVYVVAITRDVDVDTAIKLTYQEPGQPPVDVVQTLPAGSVAGTSLLFAQPVTTTARVTLLTMTPEPFDNRPEASLALTVLLGTTAKLLWVLGAGRDELRGHAVKTLAQRHLPTAVGLSLDLIGFDLGVPRFPPLPYGFDPDTVALYHLDELPGPDTTVAFDQTALYPGRTGHPGTFNGPVQLGLPGRYGPAMGFRTAPTWLEATTGTDFDIGATDGATMEFFVRPDAGTRAGPVLSRHPSPGGDGPGWVFQIGDFGRGVDRNVRFTISDGTQTLDLFADTSLPTDAFTHVAAVVDRLHGRVSLFLDGQLKDFLFAFPIGAVTNTADLLIGPATGGFSGLIDEVRISSVARSNFAPALGEDDDHYRARLALFHRWTLPTPTNLATVLNQVVGPIGPPDPQSRPPLVLDDSNPILVRGTRLVNVRPVALLPGTSIDAAGRRTVSEVDAVGTAVQEENFGPAFLFRYDRTEVDFTPPPVRTLGVGELPADPHLVQVAVAARLDELVVLAGAEPAPAGRLLVDSAFDPRATDLRATGRAVRLGHSTVPPNRLAALAHRAGFDYVAYRPGPDTGQVYAATAIGDYLAVDLDPAPSGLTDLTAGTPVTLSLRPAPPKDAFVQWVVVPSGAGRATLTTDGGSSQPTASLLPTAPGRLTVKADVTRGGHTTSATRVLRVGLADLLDGASVAGDGTPDFDPSIVDRPGTFFDPAFLLRHDDLRVDYGTDPDHHLVQPAVAELLDALLDALTGQSGQLMVTAAFDPGGDLAGQEGRRLLVRHSALDPGALAVLAFGVGFGFLRHTGADLELRQPPGQLVEVRGPVGTEHNGVIELDEGASVPLTVTPTPTALGDALAAEGIPDQHPLVEWASGGFDEAGVTLDSSTQPGVTLHADATGTAWVQACYQLGGQPAPYTFQVRLRPDLDVPGTVITKDQHGLIMNVLNVLHPVGVEVITSAIRPHVIELQGTAANDDPDYTYPKFRVRGTLPPQVRRPTDG